MKHFLNCILINFSYIGKTFVEYLARCGKSSVLEVTPVFLQYALVWQAVELFFKYCIAKPFGLLSRFKNKEDQFACSTKFVSLVHAIVSSLLAFSTLYNNLDLIDQPVFGFSTQYWDTLTLSCGYFVYDFVVYLRLYLLSGTIDSAMIAHHFLCLFGITYSMVYGVGLFSNIALLTTEITTPLLHVRWYLMKLDMEKSSLYKINGLLFALGFLVFRVIGCGLICFHIYYYRYTYSEVYTYVVISIIFPWLLFCLNLFWFRSIGRMVLKALSPSKPKHQ